MFKNVTQTSVKTLLASLLLLTSISNAWSQEQFRVPLNIDTPLEVPSGNIGQATTEDPVDTASYPSSCEQILANDADAPTGEYTVYASNNPNSPRQADCNMTINGGGYELTAFSLDMLANRSIISPYNEELGVYDTTTPLTQSDISQYNQLISANKTDLVRMRIMSKSNTQYEGDLVPWVNASFFRDTSIHELPNRDGLGEVPIIASARVDSWASDNDTSRVIFDQSASTDFSDGVFISSRRNDSGNGNWPSTRTYLIYNNVLDINANYYRFYGNCTRFAGTQCSAGVWRASVLLYPKLPRVGEQVYVK